MHSNLLLYLTLASLNEMMADCLTSLRSSTPILFLVVFYSFETGSCFVVFGWPGSRFVSQAGLELIEINMSLVPQC